MMKRRLDLLAVIGFAALHAAMVFLGVTGPVRVASGFIFLGLLPGYSFMAACYRRYRQDYNVLEQVALAVPVSLAISAILGMLLNTMSLAIRAEALVAWMGLFTCGLAVIGMARAAEQIADRRFVAVVGGIVGVALGLGLVVQSIAPAPPDEQLNLYLLDARGQTEAYPAAARVNVPFQVRVGVTYHGPAEQLFQLVSSTGAQIPLTLQPGAQWEAPMDITITVPGVQRISWNLYRSDANRLERAVQLWVKAN
jgi:uncharacterized membrane protein